MPGLTRVTDQAARRGFWSGWLCRHLPTEIGVRICGVIERDDAVVVCITGNGYKTTEVVQERMLKPVALGRGFKDFEGWFEARKATAASA